MSRFAIATIRPDLAPNINLSAAVRAKPDSSITTGYPIAQPDRTGLIDSIETRAGFVPIAGRAHANPGKSV